MKIKKKPCVVCCEGGDCSDKYIKAKNMCAFHYSIELSKKKPSKALKSESGVGISLGNRKSPYRAKKRQILDFNAEDSVLEGYSVSELRKVCDFWFRKYLMKLSGVGEKGFILCPLTNIKVRVENAHVCHFVDRARMSLRYSEDNCVLCSKYTNTIESRISEEGYKSLHHKKFEDFLGAEKIEKLKTLSEQVVIYTKEDYLCMINKFKST